MKGNLLVIDSKTSEMRSLLRNEAFQCMTKFLKDSAHSIQVGKLAVQLFDKLSLYHGYGEEERFYLECGAYLHDIGLAVGDKKHHKHSLRLILDGKLPSFNQRDKRIIANIARYHRRSSPKPNHHEFLLLSPTDREIVNKMAGILRVADALDRSRRLEIDELTCIVQNGVCQIYIDTPLSIEGEIKALDKKKDLFNKVFGLDVRLTAVGETREMATSEASPGSSI
ncbi:MAG: HD domain-containing protein [Candidatus Omnitrophota bacterium]